MVIITGAGSGLGRELSKVFSQQGANVVGLGRTQSTLEETAALIDGDSFSYYVADVSNFEEVESIVEQVIARYSQIHIVFNNAAVYPKINFLSESAADFAGALAVNVVGTANMCKAVLPNMIKNKYGRIYNCGSWADLGPIENSAAYSASKGALHALTKAISVDVISPDLDLEVHEWIPGHMNTDMSGYTGMDPKIPAEWALDIAGRSFPDKTSKIFEGNSIFEPPKGLKQRLKDNLFFWR